MVLNSNTNRKISYDTYKHKIYLKPLCSKYFISLFAVLREMHEMQMGKSAKKTF